MIGSWVKVRPSLTGYEAMAALHAQPFQGRWVRLGPRVGYLRASENGATRSEWNLGGEGLIWFLNAIGPGLALDWVLPSHSSLQASSSVRVEPFLALRIFGIGQEGALGVRMGALYDTAFQWGFRLGLSFEPGHARGD